MAKLTRRDPQYWLERLPGHAWDLKRRRKVVSLLFFTATMLAIIWRFGFAE